MKATVDKVEIKHIPDEAGSEERGEPCVGVRAVATVRVFLDSHPDGHALLQEISSAGLWGVEVASDAAYFEEVADEERAALAELLAAFGLRIDHEGTDADAMDRLAAMLNTYHEEEREWDHASICNGLVEALRGSGREVKLTDEEEA